MLEADLDVRKGAFHLRASLSLSAPVTALCGPSGSGKTTFLRALAGLEEGGKIVLNGRILSGLPPERRRVGLVPQEPALFPHLSVRANVRYGGAWRFDEVVARLGIDDLLGRSPGSLSGGQRRRVSLARALCAEPKLLLLDEPLAGLDLPLRERVLSYLGWLRRAFTIPMVYVSHQIEEILGQADGAVLLERGRIRAAGACGEVLARAGLADFVNRFSLSVAEEGRTVTLGGQIVTLADPVHGKIDLLIRAEEILLAVEAPRGLSARNLLRGVVREVRALGNRRLVTVDVGVPLVASITPDAEASLCIGEGREVYCVFKATSLRSVSRADERV